MRMPETRAALILAKAIQEERAAEFLECLFEGGAATVDTQGNLLLITHADIEGLRG